MTEWKEGAKKRRDFRAVKGDPEKAKPSPRKKTNRPHLVLYRVNVEIFAAMLKEGRDGSVKLGSCYWHISKEFRKSNNAWRVWGRHHARHSALESAATLRKDRYYGREYEFSVLSPEGG